MDIKIKDFEGPLDLLLHLVSRYQMDIYDVPITEVIEQYLAYIATLQTMRLEIAGDYMVMASQLMLIKSRKLLPTMVIDEPDLEDPEQVLLEQLEEYRKFKALSQGLASQHEVRARHFSKSRLDLVYDDVELARDKNAVDIYLAFSQIMTAKQASFRENHTTIAADEYKIEDMMTYVENHMPVARAVLLDTLFDEVGSMNELVTLFLAVLELIKIQTITISQAENFGPIYLRKEVYEPIS